MSSDGTFANGSDHFEETPYPIIDFELSRMLDVVEKFRDMPKAPEYIALCEPHRIGLMAQYGPAGAPEPSPFGIRPILTGIPIVEANEVRSCWQCQRKAER